MNISMRAKTKEIRDTIIKLVPIYPDDLVEQVAKLFSISRQSVYKHINALIEEDRLAYDQVKNKRVYKFGNIRKVTETISLTKSVSEHDIYIKYFQWVEHGLSDNVKDIIEYGFTEILNNVIDHSESDECFISVERGEEKVTITIDDFGEGIFSRITRLKKLNDERQALLELQKGKLTTDPDNHTGEGIFFSSRAFDDFIIFSGDLVFLHDESLIDDYLLEASKNHKGTSVIMAIRQDSKTILSDVFDQFAEADEFSFNKTIVPVKLAKMGHENLVSRSQAKRVLLRLENFKTVIFDFEGVDKIGQAFADEIFRVYQNKYPEILLKYSNVNSAVERMIKRALINARGK